MTAHSITWDHSDCEHDESADGFWCSPSGTVTCTATGFGEDFCRARCSDPCGEFMVCNGNRGCQFCTDDPSITGPHDVFCGTPIVEAGYCNAVEFLSQDLIDETREYVDGPITVRWDGDSYEWEYADPTPTETQGAGR